MQLLELLRKTSEQLEKASIDDALADAEMLVFHAADTDRLNAYMNNPEAPPSLISKAKRLVKRRLEGEPVQYIIGHIEFLGLKIHVGKGVLIPRPETELLVEEAVREIGSLYSSSSPRRTRSPQRIRQCADRGGPIAHHSSLTLLDLCTGSGCIALSLAKAFPESIVYGTDLSKDALRYARKNSKANDINNIKFLQGSLFEPVRNRKFDLITANPPYIRKDEIETLQREIRDWEPLTALDGGEDGLGFYRTILSEAGSHLNPGGWIFLELGYDQAEEVRQIAEISGLRNIQIINDYAGIGRVLKAQYA